LRSEERVVLTEDGRRRFESLRERLRLSVGDEIFTGATREEISIEDAVRVILDIA
jgi:DNA-binding MarR family transcriptional regulator